MSLVGSAIVPPERDRHIQRLGFRRHPFPVIPDVSQYHLTPHLEVLAREVLFAVQQRGGFIVLTGEVGLGKSTFCRYLLGCLNDGQTSTSLVFNSYLQEDELIEQIILDFGLANVEGSVREKIETLNQFFLHERAAGRNCVIFIDDAQNLSPRSLEYVRLLSNLETEQEKLVQVLLVGQPELRATLSDQALRQLKSRITLEREFSPLSRKDARAYIETKLARAQGDVPLTISVRASDRVYRQTAGNPRAMNLLLDRVLLSLIARRRRHIGVADVVAAQRDIGAAAPRRMRTPMLLAAIALAGAGLIFMAREASYAPVVTPYADWWARGLTLLGVEVSPPDPLGRAVARVPTPRPAGDGRRPTAASTEMADAPGVRSEPLQALTQSTVSYLAKNGLTSAIPTLAALIGSGRIEAINQLGVVADGRALAAVPYRLARLPAALPVAAQEVPGGAGWYVLAAWNSTIMVDALTYGRTSERVGLLQQRLKMLGFYEGPVDGIAGALTLKAVANLQRRAGLVATSRLDNATRLAIDYPDFFAGLTAHSTRPGTATN